MKLTEKQCEILAYLATDGLVTASAYAMGCSTNTLWALERDGLVSIKRVLGNMAFPRNAQWRITPVGRAALKEAQE